MQEFFKWLETCPSPKCDIVDITFNPISLLRLVQTRKCSPNESIYVMVRTVEKENN